MSESSTGAAHFAIESIVSSFHYQLQTKDAMKKLPQHLQQQIVSSNDQIIYMGNLPTPSTKYGSKMKEDFLMEEPACQALLTSGVPTFLRKEWSNLQASTQLQPYKRNLPSRYASTSDIQKNKPRVKIDLNSFKQGLVHVQQRQEVDTAKSFRSVIQLDHQLRQLRSTYLKQLKEEAKNQMSQTQQLSPPKKKRIPRDFTYGISGQFLERRPYYSKKTAFSPLRAKSVSVQKIVKKEKRLVENPQDDENLEEILQRASTKTGERKTRQFNNESKRQVSHIPFIFLTENTKLFENSNILKGPESPKTFQKSKRQNLRSTFTHYFREQPKVDINLIDEDQASINLPQTFVPEKQRFNNKQGIILKNSRFGLKESINESKSSVSRDFNPINVTRDHGIDKYYKIKKSTQLQE